MFDLVLIRRTVLECSHVLMWNTYHTKFVEYMNLSICVMFRSIRQQKGGTKDMVLAAVQSCALQSSLEVRCQHQLPGLRD